MARDLKNATRMDRHEYHEQRSRIGNGVPFTVRKAKLLSHAEYRAAEGNPDTPLHHDGPSFDKVAASGRSAGLLNMDWTVRTGHSDATYPAEAPSSHGLPHQ